MNKAVVMLSAGLDSTVNLYQAMQECQVIRVLTFDYGQKAAKQECRRSQSICEKLHIPHEVVFLPWLASLHAGALVNGTVDIPKVDAEQLDDLLITQQTAKSVWVPNRNGLFLNVAAVYAEALGAQWIVPGFNREEALTFPDNSTEFIEAVNRSLHFSTATGVTVKCFTAHLNKTEIVKRAKALGVDFQLLWPCYEGGEILCGQCESCQRFQRALQMVEP